MSSRTPSADLRAADEALGLHEARVLTLLTQAPLLWADAVRALTGLNSRATTYRCLKEMEDRGLVGKLNSVRHSSGSPGLYHLADLGVAVVARMHGLDAAHLAQRYRLRGEDLVASKAELPYLGALYELAVSLVPDGGRLVRWARPWRCRYLRPTVKAAQHASLPAYAEIAHATGRMGAYLLLPDRGQRPLASHRPTLKALAGYDAFHGEVPDLLVATTSEMRCTEWERLLDEVYRGGLVSRVPGYVFTWEEVHEGIASRVQPRQLARSHAPDNLVKRAGPEAPLTIPAPVSCGLRAHTGINLSPHDRELLELVARHPFLSAEDLTTVLDWNLDKVARIRRRLIRATLLRQPDEAELGSAAGEQLTELTAGGLRIVAAEAGLSPATAITALGLSGGGPDEPFGQRRGLARNLEHTLGVNAILTGLYQVAAAWRRAGSEYYVTSWVSAAECSQGDVRPDGRGMLWLGPVCYEFFLEYDRATEREAELVWKFDAYRRLYERHTPEPMPTVLVVTNETAREEQLARAVLTASAGHSSLLPILITTEKQVGVERDGLLGRIWREPVDRGRRHWLRRPVRMTTLGYGTPPSEPGVQRS